MGGRGLSAAVGINLAIERTEVNVIFPEFAKTCQQELWILVGLLCNAGGAQSDYLGKYYLTFGLSHICFPWNKRIICICVNVFLYLCICGAVSDYLSCLSKYKVSDPAVIRAQPRQHKTFTTLLFQEYKYENKSVGNVPEISRTCLKMDIQNRSISTLKTKSDLPIAVLGL